MPVSHRRPGIFSSNIRMAGLLVIFVGLSSVYLLMADILARIGLPQFWLNGVVLMIPLGVFIDAGFAMRNSGASGGTGLVQFYRSGGAIGPTSNSMAAAGEWFGIYFTIGIIGALAATNYDGIATLIGAFAGIAFMAIFILPRLSGQKPISLSHAIGSAMDGRKHETNILRLAVSSVVIICAMIFFVAQLSVASRLLVHLYPMAGYQAAIVLMIPVTFTLLAAGMRGLSVANILLIFIIGAAILLPTIWLAIAITGNPVPQLTYGIDNLQPLLQLEKQLLQQNPAAALGAFERGNITGISAIADFISIVLSMMAGTAALPFLYGRLACSTGTATRIRSLGWTIVIITVLASALPAFVIFMKFEIYQNFVGLQIDQIGEGLSWLKSWAGFDTGGHALVCGQPPSDLAAITAACGNGPTHVLKPGDLRFSSLVMALGAGQLSNMPMVYSALSVTGVLTAAAATSGIAMMIIVNTVSTELIFPESREVKNKPAMAPLTPIARQLFISRLMLIGLALGGIWLANLPMLGSLTRAVDFSLWAFALAASTIFPTLILALGWRGLTVPGALTGILAGAVFVAYFAASQGYGDHRVFQNGDEATWTMLFGTIPLRPLNLAILITPVVFVVMALVSVGQSQFGKWWVDYKAAE